MAAEVLPTPIGDLLIEADEARLLRITFEPGEADGGNSITQQTAALLAAYFRGDRPDFSALPFNWPKGAFHARVLKTLLSTGYGSRLTYGELAALAGNPKAHRAAASAVAKNPFAVAIGCHRVVHSTGGVGRYGWGPAKKAWLLHHESLG